MCVLSGAVIVRAVLPVLRARCPKMAQNHNAVGKRHSECTETDDFQSEGGEPLKNSAATSATANQNGDQPGCGDSVMPEQETTERRRSVQVDARSFSNSPVPGQRPNFQIPRKTRERKGGAIAAILNRGSPVFL